jgi:polar amino acid transport system substrate-binding protein
MLSFNVSAATENLTRPLVLAFSPLPPWKSVDAQGHPSGPYLDIVRELAQRLGVPLQVSICPLARCLDMLKRGDADLGIGYSPGPGRDPFMDFLQPPFASGSAVGFYHRAHDAIEVKRYQDLRHWQIGVAEGAHYFPRFDQDGSLAKDAAPDKISNFRKLLAMRVDVAIMLCAQANLLLREPEFRGKIQLAGPVVITLPRTIALSRASSFFAQKPRIERVLREMVASGDVRRKLQAVEPETP